MTKYFTQNDEGEYSEVEEELLTQEQLSSIIAKRSEQYARQHYADYDDLKSKAAKVDEISSEYEAKLAEATEKTESLEKQLGEKDTEIDKIKLLSEFKLNDDMAEFITGDTPEERRRRAEKLAKTAPTGLNIEKTSKKTPEVDERKALSRKLFNISDD